MDFLIKFKKNLNLLVSIYVLVVACAKQGMPPGGPEDKLPPRVIETIPDSAAVQVPRDQRTIQFRFNENVQPSALDAVFITPYVDADIKYKLKGRELSITLPDSLLPNTTYVFTLGTGVRDYRNNALQQSFTLAFSTGDSLDGGHIFGRVADLQDAKGVDVWAYQLQTDQLCNPITMTPDYIVQCAQNGDFNMIHMKAGNFRLFAVKDRVLNRLYDIAEDQIGVGSHDICLSSENHFEYGPVFFKMSMEDTLSPRLLVANSVCQFQIQLRFDEPIQLSDSSLIVLNPVTDSSALDTVKYFYFEPQNVKMIRIIDSSLEANISYQVHIESVYDLAGNAIIESDVEFENVSETDTTNPKLTRIQPKPKQRDVHPDSSIIFEFSEPMDTVHFSSHVMLSDTAERPLAYTYKWFNPAQVELCPLGGWPSSTICRVGIDSTVSDLSENTLADTLFTFVSVNPDTLSEISGSIRRNGQYLESDLILHAIQLTKTPRVYQLFLPEAQTEFSFQKLMPGNYVVNGYYDLDHNGQYSYGSVWPYKPAEPYTQFPDTILARSRWPNEGNQFKF